MERSHNAEARASCNRRNCRSAFVSIHPTYRVGPAGSGGQRIDKGLRAVFPTSTFAPAAVKRSFRLVAGPLDRKASLAQTCHGCARRMGEPARCLDQGVEGHAFILRQHHDNQRLLRASPRQPAHGLMLCIRRLRFVALGGSRGLSLASIIRDADRIATRARDDQADMPPVFVLSPDRHSGLRTASACGQQGSIGPNCGRLVHLLGNNCRAVIPGGCLRQHDQLAIGKFRHLLLLRLRQHPLSPARPREGARAGGVGEKDHFEAVVFRLSNALERAEVKSINKDHDLRCANECSCSMSSARRSGSAAAWSPWPGCRQAPHRDRGQPVADRLSGCKANYYPDEGHISLIVNHGEEIVKTLVERFLDLSTVWADTAYRSAMV